MLYLYVEEDTWKEIWKTQWGQELNKADNEDEVGEI